MVELVKGKLLIGPVVALIGGLLLLIAGIIGLTNPLLQFLMILLPLLAVPLVMALIFGLIAMLGAILAMTGKSKGNYITAIIGIITTIGMFIPLFVISLAYIDPILILIGGILGIVIKE